MMMMMMILASLLGCELPNHLHNHFQAPSFSRMWWLWKGLDPRFPASMRWSTTIPSLKKECSGWEGGAIYLLLKKKKEVSSIYNTWRPYVAPSWHTHAYRESLSDCSHVCLNAYCPSFTPNHMKPASIDFGILQFTERNFFCNSDPLSHLFSLKSFSWQLVKTQIPPLLTLLQLQRRTLQQILCLLLFLLLHHRKILHKHVHTYLARIPK